MWRAARGVPHTCSHVDPSVPNSSHSRHFSRPHDDLFQNAGHSRTGFLSRAHPGRSENEERTLDATFCGAGAISKINPSTVWVGPHTISMHAMTLAFCTHFNTHSGTSTSGARVSPKDPGVSIPPQARHVPFRIMQRLHLVRSYRTHLVTVRLEGAHRCEECY